MPEANPVDDRPADAVEPAEPAAPAFGEPGEEPPLHDEGGITEDQAAAFWADFGTILNRFGPTPEWAPDAWLMTPTEAHSLAVPSVTIANARAPMVSAVVAKHSAEVALGIHLIDYFKHNMARVRPPEEDEIPPAAAFPQATDFDEDGNPIEPAEPHVPGPGGPAPSGEDVIDDHTRPYFEQPGFAG